MTISAGGRFAPANNADAVAIGSLDIAGAVAHADILAGYLSSGSPFSRVAQIGTVTIGGTMEGTDIVAGADRGGDREFGTFDDAAIDADFDSPTLISKIASVVVGGAAIGPSGSFNPTFGIVAARIGAVSIGGTALTLQAGPGNDDSAVGTPTAVIVHELGAGGGS